MLPLTGDQTGTSDRYHARTCGFLKCIQFVRVRRDSYRALSIYMTS